MTSTSLSLIERARTSDDEAAWRELAALYAPLLRRWLLHQQVAASDADDLVQEVLLFVWETLPEFDHNGRKGAFRCWLRTALANRMRKLWTHRDRKPAGYAAGNSQMQEMIAQLEDPRSSLSQLWNREHDEHVLSRLMDQLRQEFGDQTWEVFRRTAIEGQKPQQVAAEMKLTPNAVWVAKSKVLRRLRSLANGLIETK